MNIFVSGGAKNGKSSFAQNEAVRMAAGSKPLYYVATMISTDEEDDLRIERHIKDREGLAFTTVEQGTDICAILKKADQDGVFLLDSVTALLANEMFGNGFDAAAGERCAEELVKLAKATGNTIFVSDYIYSEAAHFDEYTECYRSGLALCDKRLAKICDMVVEVTFGGLIIHKG